MPDTVKADWYCYKCDIWVGLPIPGLFEHPEIPGDSSCLRCPRCRAILRLKDREDEREPA